VLTEPSLAAELRRRGFVRARDFSWDRSVARTSSVYREVAGVAPVAADAPLAVGDAGDPAGPDAEPERWRATTR
jgi:hypothetical protein